MEQDDAPATLRDTISGAFDDVMAQEPDAPGVAPAAIPAPKDEAAPAADAPPKEAEQPRRDDGRFDKKPKGAPPATPAAAQAKPSAPASQPAAAAPPMATQRPSSWKKELEPHWATLPAEVQAEILRREGDFAKGVSTYKQEWDRARPLLDALAPFMPDLERHRIAPDQFITNLATAHRTLALGSPEQKLAMFSQLAEQYQIPLAQMFERGADGQIYLRNVQAAPQQAAAPAVTPQAIEQIVQQKLVEQSTAAEVKQFQEAKDDAGNPRYPHFETVKDTMAGLLHAGLADDLASAYQYAIRHSKHAEIFEAEQRLQREAADKAAAEERAKQAGRARRNAISTPGSTPTALVTAGKGDKGLRAQLEENFDAAIAGRV